MAEHDNDAKETIIITGASGLIGSRLAREFASDFHVCGLDIVPPRDERLFDYVETDLTDEENLGKSLRRVAETYGKQVASVIHLAAYYDFSGEPSPLYTELTVEGTRRLLRGLREFGFQVEQFVFSSTLLVMKPDEEGKPISEESPTRAEWDYPRSKLQAERVIRQERDDIPAVMLRIAGVYDDRCHSLPVAQQICRIYEKQLESFVFPGQVSHGQALVHLDDLADCFRKVVERRDRLQGEQALLIAEPDVMSYRELQEELGRLIHGTEWPTIRVPKTVAKAGAWVEEKLAGDEKQPFIRPWMIDLADDHYAASIATARETLDWQPQHRLRETLPQMIEFLKQDPKRFYEENGLPVPEEISDRQ